MKLVAVDDEPLVLDVLVKAIRKAEAGCEVQGFVRSRDALAAVQDGLRPDAAFLDIEMAGMNGLELAMRIRAISNHTKIIFVTGYPQYALEAYSIHARGYLLKPPTAENVRSELDELKCPPLHVNGRIRAQTFGNFEIFVDDKPLHFSLSKTKELLAYLVDRRGGGRQHRRAVCNTVGTAAGQPLGKKPSAYPHIRFKPYPFPGRRWGHTD